MLQPDKTSSTHWLPSRTSLTHHSLPSPTHHSLLSLTSFRSSHTQSLSFPPSRTPLEPTLHPRQPPHPTTHPPFSPPSLPHPTAAAATSPQPAPPCLASATRISLYLPQPPPYTHSTVTATGYFSSLSLMCRLAQLTDASLIVSNP